MNIFGNIVWLIFGGLLTALWYFIIGLLTCITIIGIPFGVALFRMGALALAPFGKKVEISSDRGGCVMIFLDVLWILCGWWEIAIVHAIFGIILCITIIGIPLGRMHFRLAKFSLLPFSMKISTPEE
jgi:uncharacterized membrane protein YccF (DUF307 family)